MYGIYKNRVHHNDVLNHRDSSTGCNTSIEGLGFSGFLKELLMEFKLTKVRSIQTSVFHITRPLRSLLTSIWPQNSQFCRAREK